MGARATGLSIPSDQKQEKASDGMFRFDSWRLPLVGWDGSWNNNYFRGSKGTRRYIEHLIVVIIHGLVHGQFRFELQAIAAPSDQKQAR